MKKILIMAIVAIMALAPLCPAEVSVRSDGTRKGIAIDLNYKGPTITRAGSIITIDFSDKSADYGLDLRSFEGVIYPDSQLYQPEQDNAVSPYYVLVAGGADYIAFPGQDNATVQTGSPMEYTFKVPADYNTSSPAATFIIGCQNSTISMGENGEAPETTPNYIDWDVVINSAGSAVSTTRYDQVPIALSSTTNFQNVTLTYGTPADISAGDTVTVRIWRRYEDLGVDGISSPTPGDNVGANATSDLRVYSVNFQYTVEW